MFNIYFDLLYTINVTVTLNVTVITKLIVSPPNLNDFFGNFGLYNPSSVQFYFAINKSKHSLNK